MDAQERFVEGKVRELAGLARVALNAQLQTDPYLMSREGTAVEAGFVHVPTAEVMAAVMLAAGMGLEAVSGVYDHELEHADAARQAEAYGFKYGVQAEAVIRGSDPSGWYRRARTGGFSYRPAPWLYQMHHDGIALYPKRLSPGDLTLGGIRSRWQDVDHFASAAVEYNRHNRARYPNIPPVPIPRSSQISEGGLYTARNRSLR